MMLIIQIAFGVVLAVIILKYWKILLKWSGYLIIFAAIASFSIFLFASPDFRDDVINVTLMILGFMFLAFLIYQFYHLVLFIIEVVIFQAEYYGLIKKNKKTLDSNHMQETDKIEDDKEVQI